MADWRQWQPGVRVTVRYRLHGEEYGFTDALGYLERIDADTLEIRTKRRGVVAVPTRDIVAAKRVPPPPAPRERRGLR